MAPASPPGERSERYFIQVKKPRNGRSDKGGTGLGHVGQLNKLSTGNGPGRLADSRILAFSG